MADPARIIRCAWAEHSALERDYHDLEWGVPQYADRGLFELIVLEGAQAGLSWRTVLSRRQAYRDAFHNFSIERVAALADAELEALLADSGLIRNRLKIYSARDNARAAMQISDEEGSFSNWLWSFVGGTPISNEWSETRQVPRRTEVSDRMAKALQKRGFHFTGSTICYALMQASGMVNDHLLQCFRHAESAQTDEGTP